MQDFRAILDGRRRDLAAIAIRAALRPAAVTYGLAVRVRNARYERGAIPAHAAGVPVISVGNITAGGTGKTPMVAAIARHLRDSGIRVGVVSRGYRSDQTGSNDEARELSELLPDVPHVQNPDRVEACRVAVEELEMQAIVVDDGFQHRRLYRDLDIVLIDATCPFGYGYLLPRGLLREPLTSLRRADVIVVTRCGRVSREEVASIQRQIREIAPEVPIVLSQHAPQRLIAHHQPPQPLENLRGLRTVAVAGIGNPAPFFQTLEQLGARLVASRAMTDHCAYDRNDVEALMAWLASLGDAARGATVVCTHKDLVKLRTARLGDHPVQALQVAMQFSEGEETLWRAIDTALGK